VACHTSLDRVKIGQKDDNCKGAKTWAAFTVGDVNRSPTVGDCIKDIFFFWLLK